MLEDARHLTSGILATVGGFFLVPSVFWWSAGGEPGGFVITTTIIAFLPLLTASWLQWTDPYGPSWHLVIVFALVGASLGPLLFLLAIAFRAIGD